ncbi:MAG: hypothetical protein Q7J82_06700 [Coriobacteriia bacterium]|nr:hypothetical protein [Coriobacteriia bacterium]
MKRFMIRLDEDTHELLAKVAAAKDVPPAALAREYVEFCLTSDAYDSRKGTLEEMIRLATRDASKRTADAMRAIAAKTAIAAATSTFLSLEVLAREHDYAPAELQTLYDECRGKGVAFVRQTVAEVGE